MIELSDWVWLAVVVVWVVLRAIPRLFRARAGQQPPPKAPPQAAPQTEAWPEPTSAGQDRVGDIGPEPINPK